MNAHSYENSIHNLKPTSLPTYLPTYLPTHHPPWTRLGCVSVSQSHRQYPLDIRQSYWPRPQLLEGRNCPSFE